MNGYDELCAYTIANADPAFIHQHVVDAWAAQNAGPGSVFGRVLDAYFDGERDPATQRILGA